MSSLTKQFSLSLDLTWLVPLGIAASNAIMDLARSLKNSGSDIVIEEDLATIFGRFRIAPLMERTFRTVVSKHNAGLDQYLLHEKESTARQSAGYHERSQHCRTSFLFLE